MGSPFFQGLVSTLSGHVKDFADKKRKEREQEYEEERSVFEGLLKSPDPQLREIGLAGLLEEKPKTGWLKKRVPSEAREKVRDYFSRINEVEQKIAPKEPDTSSVIPSSYSMNLPPPTVDGATVVVPETTTLTGPPSMDNRDDLVHRPGLTPPPEMDPLSNLKGLKKKWERENSTAFGAKSPYEDTIAQAEALAASGASKEEIAEVLKAGMTGKLDPLGTKFAGQRSLKEYDWQNRVQQDLVRHGYKMDEIDARNMVTLPDGDRVDYRVMQDLTRRGIASDSNAVRMAVAEMVQSGAVTQIRTVDEDGRPITMVLPRREAPGVYTSQPSSADEIKATTQQLMKKDIETVKSLYSPELVGFGKGAKESGAAYFNKADPKWMELSDLLNRMRTGRLYELSGKAAAEWERKGISAQVPELSTLFSSPQKFETQMKMYERAVDNFLSEFRGGEFAPTTPTNTKKKTLTGPPSPPGQKVRRVFNPATGDFE